MSGKERFSPTLDDAFVYLFASAIVAWIELDYGGGPASLFTIVFAGLYSIRWLLDEGWTGTVFVDAFMHACGLAFIGSFVVRIGVILMFAPS